MPDASRLARSRDCLAEEDSLERGAGEDVEAEDSGVEESGACVEKPVEGFGARGRFARGDRGV